MPIDEARASVQQAWTRTLSHGTARVAASWHRGHATGRPFHGPVEAIANLRTHDLHYPEQSGDSEDRVEVASRGLVDTAVAGQDLAVVLRAELRAAARDPLWLFDFLVYTRTSVIELASQVVRAVPTRQFFASIDLTAGLDPERVWLGSSASAYELQRLPAVILIDAAGRARRLSYRWPVQLQHEEPGRIWCTTDLYDFGVRTSLGRVDASAYGESES